MRLHWQAVSVVVILASMWLFGFLFEAVTPCEQILAENVSNSLWEMTGCHPDMRLLGTAVMVLGFFAGAGAVWGVNEAVGE
ncbi:hypothetical protein BRD00_15375 [Halobacteriales archaeon QS_8_69_26]|nr:MAG: hypothetical protein BRD00_15375 [Halobacteriales archaeon QS_8_69_26]